MNMACYWIEWIADFNTICNNRKEPTKCERREYKVENKYSREIIWLVWDLLIHTANATGNSLIIKAMRAANDLFCMHFTIGSVKKRRYLLYYAVSLTTETIHPNIEIVANKTIVSTVVDQIDKIYKQVKDNEHSPNTEYLFNGMDVESNFLKTVQKLEILNVADMI
jgi:hypothetical protein